jgi:phosphatidylinositol 4-kinase
LHSKILLELAEVLADSRAKATSLDVEKLINKCPAVPVDEGSDILTKHDAPGLGIMVKILLFFETQNHIKTLFL